MNNLVNWFTKKKLALIGLLGSIVFFLSSTIDIHVPVEVCYEGKFCGDVSELLHIYFLVFVPVFIFSLITLKLKDQTFSVWRNFSVWVIPVFLIAISFLPTDTHGLDFVPVTKGTVIFILTILYSAISLITITWQSLKNKGTESIK